MKRKYKRSVETRKKQSEARKAYWLKRNIDKSHQAHLDAHANLVKEWKKSAKLAGYTTKRTLIGSVLGWFGVK